MDETNVLDEMPAEEITHTEKKSRGGKHSKPGKNGRRGGKKSKKGLVIALCVIAALAIAVCKAGKNEGKLEKLGGLRIVSQGGNYKLIYAVLGLCLAAIVIALFASGIAYYGLWVLAAATFLLAVYYTIKMM